MKKSMAILGALALLAPFAQAATVWYAGTGANASDSNDGTLERPVKSVGKAISLAKPGDTVVFAAGTYPCSQVTVPSGSAACPSPCGPTAKGRSSLSMTALPTS